MPLKPALVEPPAGTAPFHDRFAAVTWVPLWLQVADQPWLTFWLPGKAKPRLQAVQGAVQVLVMVTAPVKPPPPQSLVV